MPPTDCGGGLCIFTGSYCDGCRQRDELHGLRRLRDLVLAHSTSPAVPHSPAWDDQLEAVYKAAEDTR